MRKLHTDFNIPYGVSAFKTILASCFLCGAAALAEMPKTATLIPAPRGFALAEVLWTYPDPVQRNFKEFEERAANYRRRLIGAHVNCAPLK